MTITTDHPEAPGEHLARLTVCLPPETDAAVASLVPLLYSTGRLDREWDTDRQVRAVLARVIAAGVETLGAELRGELADRMGMAR